MKKGSKMTTESRQKMREKKLGNVPWNKGLRNPYSEKVLETMRSSHRGKKLTMKTKEKLRIAMIGRVITEEAKIKQSQSTKGKPHYNQRGEKSYQWKGGKRNKNLRVRGSIELKVWRKGCLEIDNYTCRKCGQHGRELNVHHKKNFAEHENLRFAIDNGITLCVSCHLKFHKKFGFTNNTEEQIIEFFKEQE